MWHLKYQIKVLMFRISQLFTKIVNKSLKTDGEFYCSPHDLG